MTEHTHPKKKVLMSSNKTLFSFKKLGSQIFFPMVRHVYLLQRSKSQFLLIMSQFKVFTCHESVARSCYLFKVTETHSLSIENSSHDIYSVPADQPTSHVIWTRQLGNISVLKPYYTEASINNKTVIVAWQYFLAGVSCLMTDDIAALKVYLPQLLSNFFFLSLFELNNPPFIHLVLQLRVNANLSNEKYSRFTDKQHCLLLKLDVYMNTRPHGKQICFFRVNSNWIPWTKLSISCFYVYPLLSQLLE